MWEKENHKGNHKENLSQTILDVAHNPAAAEYLAKRLSQLSPATKTHAVVSILSDKDIPETLRPLVKIINIWHVAPLELPRGSSAENMANYLQTLGVAAYDIRLEKSVIKAYEQALKEADRIVVFGSFHTVAPVLELIKGLI